MATPQNSDSALRKSYSELRSARRFAPDDVRSFGHRSRGMLQAGGFPLEFPALSLDEPTMKPTTMLYRNLLAMETEEQIRSHPIDVGVLMGGGGD